MRDSSVHRSPRDRVGHPSAGKGRRIAILLATIVAILLVAAGITVWQQQSAPSDMASSGAPEVAERQPVFVLGDSFAQNPYFQDQFPRLLEGRDVKIDGVGGSSLEEQRQRFNGRIDGWKSLLVILDGGLTDGNAVRPIADIIAQLDKGCGRWLYVEPPHSAVNGPIGSAAYQTQSELVAAVKARWPEHFVPLIAALAAGADGSARDRADVAAGWIPTSLRQEGDPIHLNAAGNRILAQAIVRAIDERGAMPNTPCLGASMEQMEAAANAQ